MLLIFFSNVIHF